MRIMSKIVAFITASLVIICFAPIMVIVYIYSAFEILMKGLTNDSDRS